MREPMLKVFTGPMFSGKTTRMLAALERYSYQGRTTILFKPVIDERYSKEEVASHSGQKKGAVRVSTGQELFQLAQDADVIAVDEMFMLEGSAAALLELYRAGKTILVSTLQLSSNPEGYEAFGEVEKLLPWATKIEVCAAVCSKCDRDAYYTERLVKEEKEVLVGGAEAYQPVCWKHSTIQKKGNENER